MKVNGSPRPVIGNPPVHSIVKPRAMVNIASVAIKDGILNLVTAIPLNHPKKVETNKPAIMAPITVNSIKRLKTGTSTPFCNKPAVTAPPNASTEPTERSMPAVKITSVSPTDIQTLTEICRSTFHIFSVVKKLSVSSAKRALNSKIAMSDWNCSHEIPGSVKFCFSILSIGNCCLHYLFFGWLRAVHTPTDSTIGQYEYSVREGENLRQL